jgi:hypothetical protein
MDNTVGSLTKFQRSVVIGSLLGDGYLRQVPGRKDAFLEINHAIFQRAYVDWKYEVLKSVSRSAPKERQGNGRRVAYRFYTRQSPEMTDLLCRWYQGGKKIIPADTQIDPITLAVWYMDDGSMCRGSDVYLNTQQFSLQDQELLIDKLGSVGLFATLNKDKQYYRIRFLKASIQPLKNMISAHIIPSMRYKFGYDPVETTRRSPTLITVG